MYCITGGRVLSAGGVAKKRIDTGRRVLVTGGVAKERTNTVGRITGTGGVVGERSGTGGRIRTAGCAHLQRVGTVGRVVSASRVNERVITQNRVGIGKAALLTSRSHLRRKRNAREADDDEKQTTSQT